MRIAFRILLALVVIVAVLAAAGYLHLRRSLPQTEGELRLPGLDKPVEVLRDAYGVPHIFAASMADAVRALGYVHAQDRLWQMEVNRRTAAGRLAEAFGESALEADRFLRTLGVRRASEANLEHLDAETRTLLEAYAAGVNAFLAEKPVLPIEFWLTGVNPEPWTPADSVGWVKMMAWNLGGNWRTELLRLQLARRLPLERLHELLPPYPGESYPALRALIGDSPQLAPSAQSPACTLIGDCPQLDASNNWVVEGGRSVTGKPLLANDPHLGLTAPVVWYFARITTPGLEAIGATLPGVPMIVLGRNAHIAWGATNTGPDVQDLYLERLDGAGEYATPEGPRAFEVRDEVIRVKNRPDVRLQVRATRHGPVISDALASARAALPDGHVLSLRWTALDADDLTMQAGPRLARAADWPEFLAALRNFHSPQQNFVYADREGNIGFVAAGRVPVRKSANDLHGMAPAPGWDARYDWAGFIPFAELPLAYNPPAGTIVTANHRITPPGYRHFISSEWQPPYRARRIEELLGALPRHSIGSFARIQGDVVSLPMRELLPRLLRTQPASEEARRALARLAGWDGAMDTERAEPLIAWAWWREFSRAIYADELGEAFARNWRARARFLTAVLENRDGQGRWCDDVRTSGVETCDALLAATLEAALADLRLRHGDDMSAWHWGEAHVARHEHRPFGRVPFLARWFDITVPSPGDAYTVNVGRNRFEDEARPFASVHAASLRAIYDLAEPDNSLYIHSGGQSGNILSPHYRTFTEAWARGEYIPMITDRAKLEAAGVQRLLLN
ncbi:MAG: penicillin acylase family protein [Burkholderiales bacterium]